MSGSNVIFGFKKKTFSTHDHNLRMLTWVNINRNLNNLRRAALLNFKLILIAASTFWVCGLLQREYYRYVCNF